MPLVRAALIAVTAIAPLIAGAQEIRIPARQRLDTTFAFNKSGELNLSVRSGQIIVTAWARNDARIVATSERGTILMNASSNRIRIDMRPQSNARARFEINVPIGTRVTASGTATTIDVNGTQGELTLTTVDGKITASDGSGHARIETVSGGVTLQRFSGETRVGSMTGPIRINEISGDLSLTTITAPTVIEQADLASLTVDAAQGHLDFAGRLSAQGKHRIETFGGNVELRFPDDFGATIDMESFNGKLHAVDFPVTIRSRTSGQTRNSNGQQYTINGGGALITISTLNGGVFLRKLTANRR